MKRYNSKGFLWNIDLWNILLKYISEVNIPYENIILQMFWKKSC